MSRSLRRWGRARGAGTAGRFCPVRSSDRRPFRSRQKGRSPAGRPRAPPVFAREIFAEPRHRDTAVGADRGGRAEGAFAQGGDELGFAERRAGRLHAGFDLRGFFFEVAEVPDDRGIAGGARGDARRFEDLRVDEFVFRSRRDEGPGAEGAAGRPLEDVQVRRFNRRRTRAFFAGAREHVDVALPVRRHRREDLVHHFGRFVGPGGFERLRGGEAVRAGRQGSCVERQRERRDRARAPDPGDHRFTARAVGDTVGFNDFGFAG